MLLSVKVELLKKGFKTSTIKFNNQILTISTSAITEKNGEYFVQCSDEPIQGAKKLRASEDDLIFNEFEFNLGD